MSWIYSIGSSHSRPKVLPPLLIQQLDTYHRSNDERADAVAGQIRDMRAKDQYFVERDCRPDLERSFELKKGEPSWSSLYHQRLLESLNAFNLCPTS